MKTLARPAQAPASSKAAPDPARLSLDRSGESVEARVLWLGQQAGNQAVVSLLGEGSMAVQRENDATALFGAMGQSDVLDQSVDSTPVEQMSYTQVQEEIHRYERWLAKQTGSSVLENARSQRLIILRPRLAAMTAPPGKKAGPKGPKVPKPPRPKSLDGPFNPWEAKRADVDAELNAIVAYMASGPTKAERKKLVDARLNCEAVVGEGQERHDEAIRRADVSIGVSSTAGSEDEQMHAILGKIESIMPDPERPGVYLLHVGSAVVPVGEAELRGLQASARDALTGISGELMTLMSQVDSAYDNQMDKAREHPWVHGASAWTSGAEEPEEMDAKVKLARTFQRRAATKMQANHFVDALADLGTLEGFVRHLAEKVGKWQDDLNFGAGRWLLAATIVKDGLTILASGGAAGLTKSLVAEGASLGSAALTVGGATTVAGALGAGGASVADQASRGDLSLGKTVGAMRTGGAAGGTIGFGGAATMYAQEAFGVAEAATTTSKVLRTVGAVTAANTTVNVGGAIVGGTSVKDAAITSLVTSPLAAVGNLGVEGLAGGSKTVEAIGKAAVGSGTGALGAVATGGSAGDAAHAALTGGAGSMYGSLQEATGDVPSSKPSAPKALPAGEPEPAPGPGAPAAVAPAPAEEPPAAVGGSGPVATGEELAVTVARDQGHEGEMYGPRRVEEELETDYGMPAENQRKIQQVADMAGVIVELRPTNPAAVARLRQGNLPKPMDIKANTVNEIDVQLGARAEDIGLVASFLPKVPVRTPAMSNAEWASLKGRFQERSDSYNEQAVTLNELTKPVADQNPAITHQKVQIRIDEHGVLRTSVPATGGGTHEVGFTGDHDMFLFRNAHTGAEITDPDHVDYLMRIVEGEAAIEHPPLKNWETTNEKQANLKAHLVQRHETKGEPLVVFAPGRPPTLRDARQ